MKRIRRIGKILLLCFGWIWLVANALVFNDSTGWALLLFYSSFLLLSGLSCLPSLKRVQLQTETVHYTQAGRSFQLPVTVQARRFWLPFFQVSLEESGVPFYQRFLYHGQRLQLTFPLERTQRGRFDNPPVTLFGGDLFGLFIREQTRKLPCTLYVLPKEDAVGQRLGQKLQQQLIRRAFGEPLPQVRGYREYRPGDNLRQVDWNVSARQRSLTIREREVGQESRPIFVFWGQGGPSFEQALSRYYAMQKELSPNVQQYIIGQQTLLLEEERVFAELKGFATPPLLPEWLNQELFVFFPVADGPLKAQVQQWRKKNQVTLYPLLTQPGESQSRSTQEGR